MRKFGTNDCKFTAMITRAKTTGWAFLLFFSIGQSTATAQDTWTIHADTIDPAHYFGVTVANGMIGLVSSSGPFRAKDIVLNGAFDLYGRGRVSNILKTFNFVNLNLDIDGNRIGNFSQVSRLRQVLDMKNACLTTTFDYQDNATVSYTWYVLRLL